MKALLVTLGSRGDVHPMLGLGQALRARGHTATLVTNPAFADEARRAGLGFIGIGSAEDYHRTLAHPKLWHPIDGLGVMWRYLLRPALRPTFDVLQQHACAPAKPSASGAAPLVLASPMAMGARVAQEALGIRLVSVYTAATMLRSVQDPLTIAQWRVPPGVPLWLRRGIWRLLDRLKLEPLVTPALDALRAEVGQRSASGSQGAPLLSAARPAGLGAAETSRRGPVFGAWMHSPLGGLALFPAWFAPAARDWPPQVHSGAFPLYDDAPGEPRRSRPEDVDAGPASDQARHLQHFLDADPPPVVFMPGSAQQGSEAFFRAAIGACHTLGLRGILLGHGAEAQLAQEPPSSPAQLFAAPYAPFGSLLPRAAAIVHHGGIGTCAQALRAGIPQLAWPQAYDQFDNAMRLELLGVGATLRAQTLDTATLCAALRPLLGSAEVRLACRRRAADLAAEDPLRAACAWLESLP